MKIGNFSRDEFACRCGCGFAAMDAELLAVLERMRADLGGAVLITSGCRCPSHNRRVGGAVNSPHMRGIAADVTVKGRTVAEVARYLETVYPDRYGIGRYKNWVHIDVRTGGPARWG